MNNHIDNKDNKEVVDTERRILDAATDVFLEKGYAAARTTEIAARAGVTHAMLHYYYRTKENLFTRILSEKMADFTGAFMIIFDDRESSLERRIASGVRKHFEFLKKNPVFPKFMVSEIFCNEGLSKIFIQNLQNYAPHVLAGVQKIIDDASTSGECGYSNALDMVLDIVSLNAFPFLFNITEDKAAFLGYDSIDKFLDKRCEQNVSTILSKFHLE